MAEARNAVSVHVGRGRFSIERRNEAIDVRFSVPTPRAALRGCMRRATRMKRAAENVIYPASPLALVAVVGAWHHGPLA